MDKANVMKALELCGKVGSLANCAVCPYADMELCDSNMCKDALALLKASETKPKYSFVWIYTKRTNMSAFLTNTVVTKRVPAGRLDAWEKHYAQERDVQLIAKFRFEKGKCICKIKSPINPMPTNDEFFAVSTNAVAKFLKKEGWILKEKRYASSCAMFD